MLNISCIIAYINRFILLVQIPVLAVCSRKKHFDFDFDIIIIILYILYSAFLALNRRGGISSTTTNVQHPPELEHFRWLYCMPAVYDTLRNPVMYIDQWI